MPSMPGRLGEGQACQEGLVKARHARRLGEDQACRAGWVKGYACRAGEVKATHADQAGRRGRHARQDW
jgi:hypothetical protein